jgi:hypothetical protein
LPRWQFLALSAIVTLESAIQGLLCRYQRHREDARAWRTIRDVARRLRNGDEIRGREVLTLAESVASTAAASQLGSASSRRCRTTARTVENGRSRNGRDPRMNRLTTENKENTEKTN